MAQWKQFGEVILNLERVVKIERRGDAVKVYLAGLLPATQGSGLGAADATPGGARTARRRRLYCCAVGAGRPTSFPQARNRRDQRGADERT